MNDELLAVYNWIRSFQRLSPFNPFIGIEQRATPSGGTELFMYAGNTTSYETLVISESVHQRIGWFFVSRFMEEYEHRNSPLRDEALHYVGVELRKQTIDNMLLML